MKKYQCPCCGFYTLKGGEFEAGPLFEICDVCFWQYDEVAHDKPDTLLGANKVTLNQAKENYRNFGASEKRFVNDVRKPLPEELPENNK